MISYSISVLYLLATTVWITGIYQNESRHNIYLIAAFLLVGTTVQIMIP